jgi:hypothetical protein
MKYLTTAQLNKIAHKKGIILRDSGRINIVERDASEIGEGLKVYTLWNPEEGYIYTNTTSLEEIIEKFNRYTSTESVA